MKNITHHKNLAKEGAAHGQNDFMTLEEFPFTSQCDISQVF